MPTYCCVHEPHEASKSLFGVHNNLEIKILWEEALGMQLDKVTGSVQNIFTIVTLLVLGTQVNDLVNIL
ncbi:Uncharacterized protein FWK35_00001918 [Aphis craccivora]|uniref:Uncharacterized protein n=1 Tax=Aphis craccivora TaxID=307492 RepID=A0A6G0ZH45_APHCR|nr:Uncharacterized protein FWK35_00001918 [Aphis craccivora]